MRNKSLDEIRPAKGVKIKNRVTKARKPPQLPRIVKDVTAQSSNLPPPTEEALKLVAEAEKVRRRLMDAIRHINRDVMSSSVLPENKNAHQLAEEKEAVNELWNAAVEMENFSPGEGILGVAILAVRQALLLRDAGNMLSYRISKLEHQLKMTSMGKAE